MIWLIVAPFVVMIIWGIVKDIQYHRQKNHHHGDHDDVDMLYALFFGFAVLFTLILSLWTLNNYNGQAQWEAFYEANSANYAVAVDKTASYLSSEKFVSGALVEGSIEKFQLGPVVSDRIKEWRDALNEYNTTIASMKFFDSNIWTGVMVPDEVQNMKLLVIK
jgi:hypothetical protein